METLGKDIFQFVSSSFKATLGLRMIRLRGQVIIVKTKLLRYESSTDKYIYVYARIAGDPKRVFWHRIVPIKKKVHLGYLKEVSQKILSSIVINPKPHLDNFITECINVGISNVAKGRHRVLDEESETKRDKTLSMLKKKRRQTYKV